MTKTSKHLLSKVQGILRKDTAGMLCVILLISLLATSCKKTPLLSENSFLKVEIILQGTSWKLVGFVDIESNTIKIAEPIDERCYLLTFNEDNTFSGTSSTNEIYGQYEIDNVSCNIFITNIGGTKLNEFYDGKLYLQSLKEIQLFSLQDNELKLYYNNKQNFLFFKLQKPLILK